MVTKFLFFLIETLIRSRAADIINHQLVRDLIGRLASLSPPLSPRYSALPEATVTGYYHMFLCVRSISSAPPLLHLKITFEQTARSKQRTREAERPLKVTLSH